MATLTLPTEPIASDGVLMTDLLLEMYPTAPSMTVRRNRLKGLMKHYGLTLHGPTLVGDVLQKWLTKEDADFLRSKVRTRS